MSDLSIVSDFQNRSDPSDILFNTSALSYGRPLSITLFVLVVVVFVFGYLGLSAPIASSVIVSASLVVESSRLQIQHADGGTVKSLWAAEGAAVEVGQLLVEFDDRQVSNELRSAEAELAMITAMLARLGAEQSGATAVAFPPTVQGIVLDRYPEILRHEVELFGARRAAMLSRLEEVKNDRAEGIQSQVSLQQQLAAARVREKVAEDELTRARALVAERFVSASRIGQLESAVAAAQSDVAVLVNRNNDNDFRQIKGASDAAQITTARAEQVAQDILQAERERVDLQRRFSTLQAQVGRIEVRSPVKGHIINLLVHSPGAIVTPAGIIAEIVPDESPVFLEAQVRPGDISGISVGSVIRCRLRGKDGRSRQLTANIVTLSADRLIDRQRGTSYFSLRAKLNIDSDVHSDLRNGMPLDLMINTGQATVVERFTRPIIDLFENNQESH